MRRTLAALVAIAAVFSMNTAVSAAKWIKVGTSDTKYTGLSTNPDILRDRRRVKFSGVTIDPMGNIYVATNVAENKEPASSGGLTIFKTDGSKVHVNLAALGYYGPVTKMVTAGDGLVYALQNWLEINWSFNRGYTNRILQITSNGTVTPIWCPDKNGDGVCDIGDDARIGGMAVGGDGNVYWTAQSADSYWRNYFLWRYEVAQGMVEGSPQNGLVNNGWLATTRMFDFEYVGVGDDGEDYFAVIWRRGASDWELTSIRWVENISGDPGQWPDNYKDGIRRIVFDTRTGTGWGRDWVTGFTYDPLLNKLYATFTGSGGSSSGFPIGGTCIITRWNGDPDKDGLFTHFIGGNGSPESDRTHGVISQDHWHANHNDPYESGVSNFSTFGQYWVQAAAINPQDGRLWTSYGADPTYSQADLGHVTIHGADYPSVEYWDAGVPEENSWVMALTFANNRAYAVTLNFETESYSVYYTEDTFPQSPGPQIGSIKSQINGLVVTTGESVVTYPYPNQDLTNYFYIQNTDRSAGIQVRPADAGTFVMLGDQVTVTGQTLVINGEAVINKAAVTSNGPGINAEPLQIVSRDLGGSGNGIQFRQLPGSGLNNIGLLVKVNGRMTEYDTDEKGLYFRLDDGSGIQIPGQDVPGVKVRGFPPTGTIGDFLTARGVLGVEWNGNSYETIIRTRDFMDVELIGQ